MKCLLVIWRERAGDARDHVVLDECRGQDARRSGGLVVITPQWNLLCDVANVWLRPKSGTDGVLLNGMAKYIIDEGLGESGLHRTRTERLRGPGEASLADFTFERRQRRHWRPRRRDPPGGTPLRHRLQPQEGEGWGAAGASSATGLTQHLGGVDNVLALNNLALVTGNVGREFAGVNTFVGDNNTQGVQRHGRRAGPPPGLGRH